MTAAQLWFLSIFRLELSTNAVQELYVALLRVLLQSCDECPRHGTSGLAGDVCILSKKEVSISSMNAK